MKLKEIIENVLGRETDFEYFNSDLSDLKIWESWYRGKTNFHKYTITNNGKTHPMERFSLGMAKKVSEEWANLVLNEKTDITIGNDKTQKAVQKVLKDSRFWTEANINEEKVFALSIGAWVVSVNNLSVKWDKNGNGYTNKDGTVHVECVSGNKVKPFTFVDNKCTECAFVSKSGKKAYISIHAIGDDGFYRIYNINATCPNLADEDNYSYDSSTDITVFYTESKYPWFVLRKPNISNNKRIESPLGISVFANAIDTLKNIDLIFDSYYNEFSIGRKRIFIKAKKQTIDRGTGEYVDTFDINDVALYMLDENDEEPFIQDNTQTLRIQEHESALQGMLNVLSYQCGFGTEYFRFDKGSVATATQVISENSELFRNIKKHEILIEENLIELASVIIYAINRFTIDSVEEAEIEVKFDDSIIEDKASEKQSDLVDVNSGIMSKAEYRSKWYNEDIDTAKQAIEEIEEAERERQADLNATISGGVNIFGRNVEEDEE